MPRTVSAADAAIDAIIIENIDAGATGDIAKAAKINFDVVERRLASLKRRGVVTSNSHKGYSASKWSKA